MVPPCLADHLLEGGALTMLRDGALSLLLFQMKHFAGGM